MYAGRRQRMFGHARVPPRCPITQPSVALRQLIDDCAILCDRIVQPPAQARLLPNCRNRKPAAACQRQAVHAATRRQRAHWREAGLAASPLQGAGGHRCCGGGDAGMGHLPEPYPAIGRARRLRGTRSRQLTARLPDALLTSVFGLSVVCGIRVCSMRRCAPRAFATGDAHDVPVPRSRSHGTKALG